MKITHCSFFLFMFMPFLGTNAQTLQTVTNAGQSTTNAIRATGFTLGTVSGPGAELYYFNGTAYLNGYDRTANAYVPLFLQGSVVKTNTRLCVNGATDDGSSALQVNGDVAISSQLGIIIDVDPSTGYTTQACSLAPSPVEYRTVRFNCSSSDPGGGWEFYNSNTSSSLLYVKQNGNVGVGTANPQSLFSVAGNITAKKITVLQTGWSDFVFDGSYQRMSLDNVSQYISQYKHLPQIPSAAEVEKDGLDLGAMQKLHMQKIEELTLYAIDADRRINKQDSVIARQQQELKAQGDLLLQMKDQLKVYGQEMEELKKKNGGRL